MPSKLVSKVSVAVCLAFLTLFGLCSCASTAMDGWYGHDAKSVYVELDANATTGYEWAVSIEGDCVVLANDEYVPYKAAPDMVGVGGVWKCRLDAAANGTCLVRFDYLRPWDKTDVAESRLLSVSVSNGAVVSVKEVLL